MSKIAKAKLTRRSFFIDEDELKAARKVLGVETDAEAVRGALREVALMKGLLARFMERTRGKLPSGFLAS